MAEKIDSLIKKLHHLESDSLERDSYPFFGRNKELHYLEHYFNHPTMEGRHFGVYGPRRSGKTYTVNHFFNQKSTQFQNEGCVKLNLTGDFFSSNEKNFTTALNATEYVFSDFFKKRGLDCFISFEEYTRKKLPNKIDQFSWFDFFLYLSKLCLIAKEFVKDVKVLCFFDEVNWFDKNSIWFLNGYSKFINQQQNSHHFVFTAIACSSNGWFNKHIRKNVGGLYKRLSLIEIKPFSFSEIVDFFKQNGWNSNKENVLDYYLLLGGYLKHYHELSSVISFNQPLKEQCSQLSELTSYFEKEYADIFNNIYSPNSKYKEIMECVVEKKFPNAEIVQTQMNVQFQHSLKIDTYKKRLRELSEAGLLKTISKINDLDGYICIHPFAILKNFTESFKDWHGFYNQFYNWRGYAFELLCASNVDSIIEKFNFAVGAIDFDFKIKTDQDRLSAQFDLIVLRQTRNPKRQKRFVSFEIKSFNRNKLSKVDKEKLLIKQELLKAWFEEQDSAKIIVDSRFIVFGGGDDLNCIDLSALI